MRSILGPWLYHRRRSDAWERAAWVLVVVGLLCLAYVLARAA
jgi:hypothetical protein